MSAAILALHDVHVLLDHTPIVHAVSLELEPGRVHGLVGPNGAGKSTLLRAIACLRPIARGTITSGGRCLSTMRARERARTLAFLPQDTAITTDFTVGDLVQLGRYAHQGPWQGPGAADDLAVTAALAQVGLTGFSDRLVTTLSGGQRQLALFAKCLAQGSALLLLDEPVSALDIRYQVGLLTLVRQLAAAGHTIVLVLHDLALAARYCDTLTVLHQGQVAASGPPATVLTADLLAAVYGVHAHVGTDPATGTSTVTALAVLTERKP